MTSLTQHPLSAAFPAMPADDFNALCADITVHGLIQPIVLFESQVIDGWHRYLACESAGIEPRSSLLPQGSDPVAFVLACNLHRRHLTASQRALAVVTCSKWRPAGKPAPGAGLTSEAAPGAGLTTAAMAKEADVSERTIRQAKAVAAKAAPDVVESVKAGKVSVKTAAAKTSKAKPAAKTTKPVLTVVESDPDLESPAEMMADMQKELDTLNALLKAADADDQKAEALKWRRAYDAAVRGQSEAMDRAHKSVEREKATKRQLMRCGKAVGEDDEFKIAPAVEAMARAFRSTKVAA